MPMTTIPMHNSLITPFFSIKMELEMIEDQAIAYLRHDNSLLTSAIPYRANRREMLSPWTCTDRGCTQWMQLDLNQ